MKEATGELNMTVIVVIAIAAIAALFYAFIWPAIQTQLATNTCKTFGEDYKAYAIKGSATNGASGDTKASKYECCKTNESGGKSTECVPLE